MVPPAPGVSSGQALRAMEEVAKETLPQGFGYEWSGLSLEEIESGGQAIFIFDCWKFPCHHQNSHYSDQNH
jgi:multidrug efflux pump subunit AcrB